MQHQVPLPSKGTAEEYKEEDDDDESSYTGMATALANAIRERRQHITDKSKQFI